MEADKIRRMGIARTVILGLTLLVLLGCVLAELLEMPYGNPPEDLSLSSLAGTWRASYGPEAVDEVILRADGSFKQSYRNDKKDYRYDTDWNKWSLERFPDRRIRLHLQGGRYYRDGIARAEADGFEVPPNNDPHLWERLGNPPAYFLDPVNNDLVHMVHELVLNVRSDSAGRLLFFHMLKCFDCGYGTIQAVWRRVQ